MTTLKFFALILLGSLLAGCSSDSADPDAEQIADNARTVSESGAQETSQDIIHMTAEDGWVDLHDLSLPESGQAWLDIQGERVEFEIECYGPGVIDHSGHVPQSISSLQFNAEFTGQGTLADGRRARIKGSRYVFDETEMLRRSFYIYSYRGMDSARLELDVFDDENVANGSIQDGPSSRNRAGSGLPMLHVQPDGTFTADTELVSKANFIPGTHEYHQHALDGKVTLAGRCSAPWKELPTRYRW